MSASLLTKGSVIASLLATSVTPVFAQTSTSVHQPLHSNTKTHITFQRGQGRGRMGQMKSVSEMPAELLQAQATILNISADQLKTELTNKTDMNTLITKAGLTEQQFHDKMDAAIKQLVADGKMKAPPARGEFGERGRGHGPMGDPASMPAEVLQAQATILNLTVDQLKADFANKTDMKTVITKAGLTEQQFHDKMDAAVKQLVADGKIKAPPARGGRGERGPGGFMDPSKMPAELLQAQATILNLSVDQLKTEITNKTDMKTLVTKAGLTEQQFHDKMSAALKQLVADGKLTMPAHGMKGMK